MRAFYQGISGMNEMQKAISVTGNNISNSQTSGYKARQARFEDAFYQQLQAAGAGTDQRAGTNPVDIGNGVRLKSIALDQTQGDIKYTGIKTDLAINGKGYFVVGDINGENQQYTRDGAFSVSEEGYLVTSDGQYLLGWEAVNDELNTTAGVNPIQINLNDITEASVTTDARVSGNLNANLSVGDIEGLQIPAYDSLGAKHDINFNFIKTGSTPSEYTYIANPTNDFEASASISKATFRPSLGIAGMIEKGEYTLSTADNGDGTIDISVTDPSGNNVLTQTISDTNQTVTLNDGVNDWFTIDYEEGNAPSDAYFQIAEVGTVEFDANGQLNAMTGSGPNGPQLDFVSQFNDTPMTIDVDLGGLTGLATETTVGLEESNGYAGAVLRDFEINDNGIVFGYFSNGTTREIGQVAVATFRNELGLRAEGSNYFVETANSGPANIGASGEGDRGNIRSFALESSNVDLAKELTDLMLLQKAYTANSKTITIANQMMDVSINLVR